MMCADTKYVGMTKKDNKLFWTFVLSSTLTIGVAIGGYSVIYGGGYVKSNDSPINIDQTIKKRSEQLYIEYKAEILALDKIEREIK